MKHVAALTRERNFVSGNVFLKTDRTAIIVSFGAGIGIDRNGGPRFHCAALYCNGFLYNLVVRSVRLQGC